MKRTGVALGLMAAATVLVPVAAPTRAAAASDGYTDITVCNQSNRTAYVAVAHKDAPGSDSWIIEGWINLGPSQCETYDVPTDGYFDYYAEDDGNGVWDGSDLQLCVQRPGPFRRVNTPGVTCDEDELVGFTAVDPNKTDRVNLNP